MAGSSRHPERLDSLTGLRYLAALAVVLLHVQERLAPHILGAHLWRYGTLGVPFFFALSGFVLTWTARRGDPARAFWRRRVARIVPLYLVSLGVGVLLLLVLPIPAGQFAAVGSPAERALTPVLSLTLLQAWIAPHSGAFLFPSLVSPNPPGWSLSDEAFFYALFPLLGLTRRVPSRGALGVWGPAAVGILAAGAMLGAWLLVHRAEPGNADWLAYFPPFQCGFFLAGIATATAVRRGVRFPPLAVAILLAVLLALGLDLAGRHHLAIATELPLDELITLPVMVALIGGAARADLTGGFSPLRGRRLVTLGLWSFALYLIQIACLMGAACVFPHGFAAGRIWSALEAIGFVAASTAIAGLAHRWIELPCEKRLRRGPPPLMIEPELR